MSAPTMRRWSCPRCGSGVNAPSRPRRDDVRRYCLDCSKQTGRLVERTCPALDRKRADSTAKRAVRTKSKRATATKQRVAKKTAEQKKLDTRFTVQHPITVRLVDMRDELPKVWRAARKVEPRLSEMPPKLVASRGGGSYAWTYRHEIHLGSGADWHTLVHEVAHFVQQKRGVGYRSDGKRAVHDRAFYYMLKDVVERLVRGVSISFYGVTSWGYNVDGVISRQVWAYGRALREQKAAAMSVSEPEEGDKR